MPPGKPFPKVDQAQRAAFGAQLRTDVFGLARDLGGAAFEHLRRNPQSIIAQTMMQAERDIGAVTVFARGLNALMREEEERAHEAARRAAAGEVIDAEFVEDDKKST